MKIRPMTQADQSEVQAMMRVFFDSPAVLYAAPDEILSRTIQDAVGDCPFIEGYVFDDHGTLCGYAMVAKGYTTEYGGICIWIEDLFIREAYRHQGLGREFFHFLHEKYDGIAVRYKMEVEDENRNAVEAYKKCGYQMLAYDLMSREVEKNK